MGPIWGRQDPGWPHAGPIIHELCYLGHFTNHIWINVKKHLIEIRFYASVNVSRQLVPNRCAVRFTLYLAESKPNEHVVGLDWITRDVSRNINDKSFALNMPLGRSGSILGTGLKTKRLFTSDGSHTLFDDPFLQCFRLVLHKRHCNYAKPSIKYYYLKS